MKKIKEIISQYENISLMIEKKRDDWKKIYDKLDYQSIDCIYDLVNYRVSYLKSNQAKNLSLIFYLNGKPIAIAPIIFYKQKNNKDFSFIGLFPPSFDSEIGKKIKFDIFEKYLNIIYNIKKNFSVQIKFNISCFNNNDYEFLSFLYDKNYKIIDVNEFLLVQNKNSFEKIFSDFRKSYKPLINSNIKNFKPEIMNYKNFDENIWSNFRKMHRKESGKITRISETWEHQKQALENNNAILVYIKKNSKFLGFSFFYYTRDESIYASSVLDGKIKNQKTPVGHLIQYEAINFFVKKRIKNYKIARVEKISKNSIKEKNILKFKQGFANSFVKEFVLKI